MYCAGLTFVGQKVIQADVIDDMDVINDLKMEVELFAPLRVSWIPKLQGTEDLDKRVRGCYVGRSHRCPRNDGISVV
jgi:hypothetical protein